MVGPLFYTQEIGVRFVGEVRRVTLPVRRPAFQAGEARFDPGTRHQGHVGNWIVNLTTNQDIVGVRVPPCPPFFASPAEPGQCLLNTGREV